MGFWNSFINMTPKQVGEAIANGADKIVSTSPKDLYKNITSGTGNIAEKIGNTSPKDIGVSVASGIGKITGGIKKAANNFKAGYDYGREAYYAVQTLKKAAEELNKAAEQQETKTKDEEAADILTGSVTMP